MKSNKTCKTITTNLTLYSLKRIRESIKRKEFPNRSELVRHALKAYFDAVDQWSYVKRQKEADDQIKKEIPQAVDLDRFAHVLSEAYCILKHMTAEPGHENWNHIDHMAVFSMETAIGSAMVQVMGWRDE